MNCLGMLKYNTFGSFNREETGVKRQLQIICMKERPPLDKTRCVYVVSIICDVFKFVI